MPANSSIRRAVKNAIGAFDGTPPYRVIQAGAVALDIRTGGWNEPELDIVSLAVHPGETAVDIGANLGLWTERLSRALGQRGRVLAFEPIPTTNDTLRLVAKLLRLGNVDVFQLACGERAERLTFTAPLQESGAISSGLVHLSTRDRQAEERGEAAVKSTEFLCDVVALDEYLPDLKNLSFVKCDIEGAELFAFRGAKQLIADNHPTVVCEITMNFLAGFGLSVDDITEFFFRQDYGWYHYDPSPVASVSEVRSIDDYSWHNYLFIHPSRLERFAALMA